jgi:hypothetical protein
MRARIMGGVDSFSSYILINYGSILTIHAARDIQNAMKKIE